MSCTACRPDPLEFVREPLAGVIQAREELFALHDLHCGHIHREDGSVHDAPQQAVRTEGEGSDHSRLLVDREIVEGEFVSPQRPGELDWSSAPILDSIQTCYDLIHGQKMFSVLLSENDFGVERLFAQQKVSVMMTSYFNLNRMRAADFKFDVAPLPYVHTPKTLLLTIGLALNRRSKQKKGGRAFIEFVTSYESQLHIRKHTYSIPA